MGLVEERISFRIAKPLLDVINEISKETGATRSEIIRLALTKYLGEIAKDEELKQQLKKEAELKQIITEGKRVHHEAFFSARFRRMIERAIKERLEVQQLIRIAEQYRREAELINQLPQWFKVCRDAIFLMEQYEICSAQFEDYLRRVINEDKEGEMEG